MDTTIVGKKYLNYGNNRVGGTYTLDSWSRYLSWAGKFKRRNTMKAIFLVNKKTAVLAGEENYGGVEINIELKNLTQEQRQALLECSTSRDTITREELPVLSTIIDSTHGLSRNVLPPDPAVADSQAVVDFLNWRILAKKTRDEEIQKENEEKLLKEKTAVEEILSLHPEELVVHYDYGSKYKNKFSHLYSWYKTYPGIPELFAEAEKIVQAKNQEQKEIKERKRQQQEAEDEEKKLAVEKQIAKWVDEHGTESQKKRHAAGLLGDKEITDDMRADSYKILNKFPRYKKIVESDFCECEYPGHTEYCIYDADSVTEAEFNLFEEFKKLIPSAKITVQEHSGGCDVCKKEVIRKSMEVEITCGEFVFTRLYAVGEPDSIEVSDID